MTPPRPALVGFFATGVALAALVVGRTALAIAAGLAAAAIGATVFANRHRKDR